VDSPSPCHSKQSSGDPIQRQDSIDDDTKAPEYNINEFHTVQEKKVNDK